MSHALPDVTVAITRVPGSPEGVPLPAYATEGSAGMDICAALAEDLLMRPGETVLVAEASVPVAEMA